MSALKFKLVPKSRAKTADGLLASIQKLILEEPKRYNQNSWVWLLEEGFDPEYVRRGPACGTIGCVAGWVSVLTLPRSAIKHLEELSDGISNHAQRLLGLDDDQADELFSGRPISFLRKDDPMMLTAKPGTKAYARLGWKHIQAFRDKYRTQLRAHKLEA